MESTRELLASATVQLAAAAVLTPNVDAELLLAHVTGRPRALLRMAGGTVTDEQSGPTPSWWPSAPGASPCST